jgi:hypothetical protein
VVGASALHAPEWLVLVSAATLTTSLRALALVTGLRLPEWRVGTGE